MINTYDFQIEHPKEFSQLAVKDSLFLLYRCPQVDKKVKVFTHHNKIMFVLEGKKMIHHRKKTWVLADGQCCMWKKSACQHERFNEVEWEVLCFYMPDIFLQKVFKEYRQHLPVKALPAPTPDILLDIHVNETTRAFFYSIIPYFKQLPPPAESLLELKFKELLFNLLSDPANKPLLAYVSSMSDATKPLLEEIMEANYTFNLSLAEFAKLSHRSLAAFKREFIQTYHTTPGKWLVQKRLAYASLLLEESNKNINEITDECGFESTTHFSRVFKEKYGMSPLQYRKNKFAYQVA